MMLLCLLCCCFTVFTCYVNTKQVNTMLVVHTSCSAWVLSKGKMVILFHCSSMICPSLPLPTPLISTPFIPSPTSPSIPPSYNPLHMFPVSPQFLSIIYITSSSPSPPLSFSSPQFSLSNPSHYPPFPFPFIAPSSVPTHSLPPLPYSHSGYSQTWPHIYIL